MAYRAVPLTDRQCAYCGQTYQAKDRRRIYCSSSCNTLAWMARRDSQVSLKPLAPFAATEAATQDKELTFSLHNVATVGAGVLAADLVKATAQGLFSNQPSMAQQATRLERLERLVEGLHQKQDALGRAAQRTAALVSDVMYGVGASGQAAKQAIIDSQQRRGVLPPAEPVSNNGR